MTIIDARTYTIPIQIPIFMTLVAFCAALIQPQLTMRHTPDQLWPFPLVSWTWASAAFGGMIGVVCTSLFLKLGVLKYSFTDYEEYIQGDELLAVYPHARREMLKELVVIFPIVIGFVIGWMLGYEKGIPTLAVQSIAGSMLGYLVGGGLVWAIRILGTLGFGREAMGLGDVHLLAGVGAIVGWWDPILIFFIAPFSGLLWALISTLLEKIGKKHREIPYGPHLAVATLLVVFCRPGIDWVWSVAMPAMDQASSSQKLQITKPKVDLTYGEKEGSIPITPYTRWMRNSETGCFTILGDWSSDKEKGHA